MGGAAQVNKAAQARLKANLDAQAAEEKAALQKYVDTASAYAKSKGATLPSNFLEFARISNMGLNATVVGNYYAPNRFDARGNIISHGGRGGHLKNNSDILKEAAAKNPLVVNPQAAVDKFLSDPGKYYSNAISESVFKQNVDAAKSYIKEAQNPAYKIPVSTLQNAINTGNDRYRQMQETNARGDPFFNAVLGVGLAYALPGIGTFLATELGVSAAVGTALASTAVQVAQGASFEDALKNATVNAVVNTGSTAVATEINNVIKNPAVTDAVVSAGASAAKTAAAGGSASDIAKNIGGAIAGSATASATGSQLAGSTVGGGVTGGVGGALSGAASVLGQDAAKPKDTTTPEKTASSGPSGLQLAQADTETVSDAGTPFVGVSGTPIFADSPRATNVKAPVGFGVMPIEMADNKPAGSYFDYTQNAWIAPIADIQKLTSVSGTPSTSIPSSPPTATSEGYTPTIITTPSPVVTPTSSPVSADKPILDLIASQTPATPVTTPATAGTTTTSKAVDTSSAPSAPSTPVAPVTQPTTQPSTAVSEQDKKMLGLISPPSTPVPTTDSGIKVDVSGFPRTETPPPDSGFKVDIAGYPRTPTEPEQTLPEVVATATQEKEKPLPVDIAKKELLTEEVATEPTEPADKYKPNLFIYGGTTPSTLPQTLGTGARYGTSVATTGLTGERGAGEIESKETGKKRKNVWNEASLRLKDALGV